MIKLSLAVLAVVLATCWVAAAMDDEPQGCTRNGRICLRVTRCNNRTKQCECIDGLVGDGTMYCGDYIDRVCTVSRDPQIRTFGKAHASLNLPCVYSVGTFRMPAQGTNNSLKVDVYARNHLTEEALFYVDAVLMNVTLVDATGNETDFITFSITAQEIWQANGSYPWAYDKRVEWHGVRFSFSWYSYDQFADFYIGYGFPVSFRAFVPHQLPQKRKPGLVLMVPPHVQIQPEIDGMCKSPGSGSTLFKDLAKRHKTKKHQVSLYLSLFSKANMDLDPPTCGGAKNIWNACPKNRYMVIKMCGFILNDRRVVKYLLGAGIDPMMVFSDCMRWACEADRNMCTAVRSLLRDKGLSGLFRSVDCMESKLEEASLKQDNIDK